MNKAVTDGLVLQPPPFAAGLSQWSRGDGTPGSDTYAGAGGGVFVPADQDFGGCMEFVKTQGTQRIRWMGQTPMMPGLYLRVTARVKVLAGALPAVRIAGWPGGPGGQMVGGLTMAGPARQIAEIGRVTEVSAIIGPGLRGGVDLRWPGVLYGHLGLDLTGPNGAIVRVDDIVVEDVTSFWVAEMLAQVDVRDYGAIGDGVANDAAAFNAADAAANGREVLVPAGTYRLDGDVNFENRVRFEGRVVQPFSRRFILQRNFDFPSYFDAFKDETLAFRKAFQALLNFSDHEGLDLGGRRIALSGPVDMQACDPSRTTFAIRRVIRNGQFLPAEGSEVAWADTVVTATASYSPASPLTLSNVQNIGSIPMGSLVTGQGVGREIYVREVNVAQNRLTLSAPLYDAQGTQTYTFRRFKYLLDFSGFKELNQFVLADIDFQCEGRCSAILLAPLGLTFALRDCFITKPKDRGISSPGSGCQGLLIDRCQFISNEMAEPVNSRSSIALNANANDVKIRDNRIVMFAHFAVLGGSGSVISGNHWFHGDNVPDGVRKGGLVLTLTNIKSLICANYIDNNFIEWTNEHDEAPAAGDEFSFGGLTITGNIFTANDVAPWFNWLVVKPFGPGHFLNGLAVVGNVFRTVNGSITRVERVDTTHADLDWGRARNITFAANSFHGVVEQIRNPLSLEHEQATPSRHWVIDPGSWLPFRGWARTVEALVPEGRIEDANGAAVYETPWAEVEWGDNRRRVRANFGTSVRGRLRAVLRMDNPQ